MQEQAMEISPNPTPITEALAYSPKDAARVTGLGLTTIYRLINEGTLTSKTVGRRRLINAASVRALVEAEVA